MRTRSIPGLLLLAIGMTVLVRSLAIWLTPAAFSADPDAYLAIAETIQHSGVFGLTDAQGGARPTAFRPPLYPWLLSFAITDDGLSHAIIAGFHLVLAAVTAGCVFSTTERLIQQQGFGGTRVTAERLGFAAAMLTAIDPILLKQSTELMTETLATALATVVIWFWLRGTIAESRSTALINATGLGAFLALAYLCRPTFLVWAVLLVFASLFVSPVRRHWKQTAMMASLVIVAVVGWTLRNQRELGHPIWATTHGGYTLLLANNESFYHYLASGNVGQVWDAEPFLTAYSHRYEGNPRRPEFWQQEWPDPPRYDAATTEYDDDRLCYESAKATILRHPGMFVWSAMVRAGRLWSPLPHETSARSGVAVYAVGVFYLLIYVAVLVTLIRHRRVVFRKQWWAIWLLALTLTAVHSVYWSNLRMRAPVMPAVAILAVLCLATAPRRSTAT
ncbi:glycosyltransferase family 39 protein [Stieleria sp. TO1_6]|uniref:ArnT family glycosyltransferase n=1 Tax=Stieleria tagensis TaxID=2956795 RepID=UPI00209BAEBB|nr:glycosyltransferase family 39 protein [Stieleria tagensis]MCO8122831.1 glycosyltransferase family 39 protein [Stieleria tagensis]